MVTYVTNNLWLANVFLLAMALFALLIYLSGNDKTRRLLAKGFLVPLLCLIAFACVLSHADRQFTIVYNDLVDVIKVENITDNGAKITYLLDNTLSTSLYLGEIKVSPTAEKATVICEVSKNWRGTKKILLKDAIIPLKYIK